MTKKIFIGGFFGVVLSLFIGFWGGIQYQKNQRGNSARRINQEFPNNPNQIRNNLRPGSGMGRPINGEIISLDNNSLTIKTQDGSNKIVIYSASTKVNKTLDAVISDLKVGANITILGSEGTSGTFTALSISLGNKNSNFLPN